MTGRLQTSLLRLLPAILAGALLGTLETVLVGVTRTDLFLSVRELVRFWGVVTCVAVSLQVLVSSSSSTFAELLGRLVKRRFALAVALVVGLCAAPSSAWLFWTLTQGRRVHALSHRPLAVSLAALLTSLIAMACVVLLMRASRGSVALRSVCCVFLLLTAAGALAADVYVLHRLYPAFHWALSIVAVLTVAAAAKVWPFQAPSQPGPPLIAAGVGLVAAALAPFVLRAAQHSPNLRYTIQEAAPLTGKVLRLLRPRGSHGRTRSTQQLQLQAQGQPPATPASQALSLRGDDVLIITIDAMRADRLRTYGAHWDIAPQLDHFAASSAVFTRAYTQTPHTSYAIGSLWTGKYLRPVLSLPAAAQEHATLPRILRRFSYRTAAFYPPAVFFVDEQRFAGLAHDHFGFEYVKEMYAPARDRVPQLREYLDQVDSGHPVFVWVHLFEPHEPYEASPEFAQGNEPEQRYNAEVAAADRAAGELIELFRARRPHSTIIVTADHGEEFADHGGHYHGTTLFDEQVRVPLLWSSPGRVTPRHIEGPAQLVDIAPTLLATLGIPRDPRMRGSDLSARLRGSADAHDARAFASIEELRMWTDGQYKLICEASDDGSCRMYDLVADPAESRDATERAPEVAQRLSTELSQLVASIPENEVLAMQSGDAWPKALAQARLGDRTARENLAPLLSDVRPFVRAEALRAIASLHVVGALPIVTTLAAQDSDEGVRREAAITGLTLGDTSFVAQVKSVLAHSHTSRHERELEASPVGAARERGPDDAEDANRLDLARRAAFVLPATSAPEAWHVLAELAADKNASLRERTQALAAIGENGAVGAIRMLTPLLDDVRLRPAVARCLGHLGGKASEQALLHALARERYQESRAAEVDALVSLGSRKVLPRILQFLGTETGLPGGLEHWAQLRASTHTPTPTATLFDVRSGPVPRAFRGQWTCRRATKSAVHGAPPGCRPGPGRAELTLPLHLPKQEGRAAFTVWASGSDEWLSVSGREFQLHRGRNELALPMQLERGHLLMSLRASPGAYIELIGVVPRSPDIPPPPPEPFAQVSAPP